MKLIFSIFVFILSTHLIAQIKLTEFDSIIHTRIYRLNVGEEQVLELVEFKNKNFTGSLTNAVWENKNKGKRELVTVKINVSKNIVEFLMVNLKAKSFENIPDCKDIEGCIEGLDGNTIWFTALNNNKIHSYSYWEVESDYYYKQKIPKEVIEVREILLLVNKQINLRQQFTDFVNRLPIGSYTYNGINMVKAQKNE